jgi:hypothetical protein
MVPVITVLDMVTIIGIIFTVKRFRIIITPNNCWKKKDFTSSKNQEATPKYVTIELAPIPIEKCNFAESTVPVTQKNEFDVIIILVHEIIGSLQLMGGEGISDAPGRGGVL